MRERLPALLLLAVWLAVVLAVNAYHEYWRDEVRALTLAASAGSPLELLRAIRYEGHPPLWYLVLFGAHVLVPSGAVLSAASIAVAFAAVAVFLLAAPLPFWLKALFVFGGLPLFEYAVEARSYGISMLMLFLIAWAYPNKAHRPWTFAALLALLANTNVHSLVFTGLLAAMWAWETVTDGRSDADRDRIGSPRGLRYAGPALLLGVGMAFSAYVIMPPADSILVGDPPAAGAIARALVVAVVNPGAVFTKITPVISVPRAIQPAAAVVATLVLYGALAGLRAWKPALLAAAAGLVVIGTMFGVLVPGDYRHQGLVLVFWVALYWITAARARPGREGIACLAALLVWNLMVTGFLIQRDVRHPLSATAAFGAYLESSERFHDAILVPEPGYALEALPYYADNDVFLPRERRFGKAVRWTAEAAAAMTVTELLAVAVELREQTDRPVLIVFGHWEIDASAVLTKDYSYNKTISWTPSGRAAFVAATVAVAEFRDAVTDETFRVYAVD